MTDEIEYETGKYARKDKQPTKGKYEQEEELPNQEFHYTSYFEFDQSSKDALILYFKAQGICPKLKIIPSNFDFGECPLNEQRHILVKVENKNEDLPIDYFFEKVR